MQAAKIEGDKNGNDVGSGKLHALPCFNIKALPLCWIALYVQISLFLRMQSWVSLLQGVSGYCKSISDSFLTFLSSTQVSRHSLS